MQQGLASGANTALNFGRNEFACELFEREIDALIGSDGRPISSPSDATRC